MKIAFNAYNVNTLDGFGGLEHRYSVSWAYFLQSEGHEIHFIQEGRGCDSSFDLYWNAPVCSDPARTCNTVLSRKHLHNYFHFDVRPILQWCPCTSRGECFFSNPYIDTFEKMQEMERDVRSFKAIFAPIAYPDAWLPPQLTPGFDRTEIMWSNKGSLDPKFGPENAPYYPGNSVELLKALIKLNKKVDFKITFVLDNLIRTARPQYGVEGLISQLKTVERVDAIPWSDLVRRMAKCKINTHAGGLTSAINEAIFVGTAPLTNKDFGFFNATSHRLNIIPNPQNATADEIYDGLEKLWFDKDWYTHVNNSYQEMFVHNRTEGLRKAWKNLLEELNLS